MEEIIIKYDIVNSWKKLSSDKTNLIKEAINSSKKAYSPYSKFKVGASLITKSGIILSANNQESEAFPSGICAERSLLYYFQSNYPNEIIQTLAIYTSDSDKISPCGACRQVLYDTEKRQQSEIEIIMTTEKECITVYSAKSLLPFSFNL